MAPAATRYRVKVEKVELDGETVAQYVVIDTTLAKTDPEGSRVTVHGTRELAENTIRDHERHDREREQVTA